MLLLSDYWLLWQYWPALAFSSGVLLYRLAARRKGFPSASPPQTTGIGAGETAALMWALHFTLSTNWQVTSGHAFIIPAVLGATAWRSLLEILPLVVILALDWVGRRGHRGSAARIHITLVLVLVSVLLDRLLSVVLWLGRMAQSAKDAGLNL